MRRTKKIICVGMVACFVPFSLTTAILFVFNVCSLDDWETYSHSIDDGKSKETFVCELEAVPAHLEWKGRSIQIANVWLEERGKLEHPWVWLRSYRRLGGRRLYITLAEGDNTFGDMAGNPGNVVPFLVLNDTQASFRESWVNRKVTFSQEVGDMPVPEFCVYLIDSWKEPRVLSIRLHTKDASSPTPP